MSSKEFPHRMTDRRDYTRNYSVIFSIDIALYSHQFCGISLDAICTIAKTTEAQVKAHIMHLTSEKSTSEHRQFCSIRKENDLYFFECKNCSISFEESLNFLSKIAINDSKIAITQKYIDALRAHDKAQVNMLNHTASDVKLNSKTYDLRKIVSK